MTEEWQPIETAPQDGTILIVAADVPGHVRMAYWGLPIHKKDYGWVVLRTRGQCIDPTHWQPSPKPPKEYSR